MEPAPHDRLCVLPTKRCVGRVAEVEGPLLPHRLLERQDELVLGGFLADQPDGVVRLVRPRLNADEPNQRLRFGHGDPKRPVVERAAVGSPPLVAGVSVGSDLVLVRRLGRISDVRREDADGGV
jgi:hypothetical protein